MKNQFDVNETRQFKLGQMVKCVAFVDCFGKQHAEKHTYIVRSITAWTDYTPYYRIKAVHPGGAYMEGAETFFAEATV